MNLTAYINTLGRDLSERYGEKVHKLSLAGDFTCPNRDGTLGRGGCTFCNVRSFSRDAGPGIVEQIQREKLRTDRARRYLAYFQAYTSTYAEVALLESQYRAAIGEADIVGLCVGTRPDCVPDAVLDLLSGIAAEGREVWLELGLQSAHDTTLARINRGHGMAAYRDATQRAHQRGLKVCTHLILGLPGETEAMIRDTHRQVLDEGVEGLKLHPLMVVRGSRMAAQYQRKEIQPWTLEAYADLAASLIQATPWDVVFHRISATAQAPTLIAPEWCGPRWPALQAIGQRLAETGIQGSAVTG